MGKLNIAHHKSYHPYRRDNIERVRQDEEEARLKEEAAEGRIMLADAEARISLLRERAGISKEKEKKKRPDDDIKQISSSRAIQIPSLPTTNGHINLFEDLETSAMTAALQTTKKSSLKAEEGVPLAPSAKDLKPWYSGSSRGKEDLADDMKKREELRKSVHDPLTSITRQLASRETSSSSLSRNTQHPSFTRLTTNKPLDVQARLSRESSERERALELIRRKKREMHGNATPSTVHGDSSEGYGDVFNKKEVEEAHRYRGNRWDNHKPRFDDGRNHNQGSRRW